MHPLDFPVSKDSTMTPNLAKNGSKRRESDEGTGARFAGLFGAKLI